MQRWAICAATRIPKATARPCEIRKPLAASSAWGVDWKALKPQGYVSDFAGAIDAASRQQLDNYFPRSAPLSILLLHISQLEHIQSIPQSAILDKRQRYQCGTQHRRVYLI